MTTYNPDRWIVLRIETDSQVIYKVFGTWLGGYLDGDSWRLNSGITSVKEDGDFLLFEGDSGSIYRCHKECQGLSSYTAGVVQNFVDVANDAGIQVSQLDENTDFIDKFPAQGVA